MRTRRAELDALIVWALATFHASFFLLAALLFLYWQDVLRNVLPGLNTALGLALFLVLWSLTLYTTRRAFSELESDDALVGRAMKWGGANGVMFLLVIAAGAAAGFAVGPGGLGGGLGFLAFFGVIGSLFAYAIGAVVGLVLALLDLLLLNGARRLVRGAVGAKAPSREPTG